MRRYWSDSPLSLNKEIQLSPELFHHICEVCRLPEGAKFELITEEQKAYLVRLVSKSKKTATIHVLEERQLPSLSRPYIRLCISLPKFNTFESILEKSVELGVHRIQPFFF